MTNRNPIRFSPRATVALLLLVLSAAAPAAFAGVFGLATIDGTPPERVTHVVGYDGTGAHYTVSVCVSPGNPLIGQLETPLQNAIDTFNGLVPTTGNFVPGGANNVPADAFDFESIALYMFGACFDLVDPSLFGGFTTSRAGPNGLLDEDPGADLVEGTGDDLRGDNVNVHWFRLTNNNPFTIDEPVDSTTYSVDLALLPGGDTFAANANLATAAFYGFPNTDPIVNGRPGLGDARRRLSPDDVATLRYAMTGLDRTAGTADDYTVALVYVGETTSCDIFLEFLPLAFPTGSWSKSGVPVMGLDDHFSLFGTCHREVSDSVNWFFNSARSCAASQSLVANQWKMVSLPCDPGSQDTVQEVFGDDLDTALYGTRWGLFERDEATGTYRLLGLGDVLNSGEGYWIKTLDSGQTITSGGQTHSTVDVPLISDPVDGVQNLVGHPFDFDVCWADARIVDGASVLTLDQADPLIGPIRACDMVPPDPSCVMSRVANKWNGAAYEAFDGQTSLLQGTLEPFDGLWVKAFKPGIALRIPIIPGSNCTQCFPQAVADAGADQTVCGGDTVTIGTPAQPDTTYSWSPGGETTAQIDVSPAVTTTYTLTATTSCGSTQDSVTVTVGAFVPGGLSEDFEGDVSGWTATGLWHLAADSACAAPAWSSPIHAFYYGQEATCNYNTGAANSGTLTSPPLNGIDASSTLTYQYLRNAETGSFDRTRVEVVTASGTSLLSSLTTNASSWTSSGPFSLGGFAGQTLQIRFNFNTVDSIGNSTLGWMIDDVVVTGSPVCTAPLLTGELPPLKAAGGRPRGAAHGWSVRLFAESADLRDGGNVFGQLAGALDGYDYHDLPEPPPFGDRYLSVVFPHDDWGVWAGEYTSDYRAPEPPLQGEWRFDVVGAGFGDEVTLSWEGHGMPVRGFWLIDEETGERVRVEPGGSYTFVMSDPGRRCFRWVHGRAR